MRAGIPAILLFGLFCTSADAEIDCINAAALQRLHSNFPLIDQASRTNDPVSALGDLTSDMRRLDRDNVDYALRDEVSAKDRQTLADFAALTNRFAQLADRGDTATLRALVQSQRTALLFDKASSVLTQLACPDQEPDGASDDGSGGSGGASNSSVSRISLEGVIAQVRGTDVVGALFMLVIGAFVAAAGTTLFWWNRRRLDRRRRMHKRFPLNRKAGYYYMGADHTGRLVDISAMGAKLEHDGVLTGALDSHVTLILAGWPRDAEVAWCNAHYAGLKFVKPISKARLVAFVAQGKDEPDHHAA